MKARDVQNNNANMVKSLNAISLLIAFLLINSGICQAQEKSPVEVVKLFDKGYGGPLMDEIADYTSARFRDNKPKSVWVVDTWKSLNSLKYRRLNSSVIDSRIKDDKAVVVIKARIKTAAGEVTQKEIYYLLKEGQKWLIDELVVTDEQIDVDKIKL
jgi:hypothetical protein